MRLGRGARFDDALRCLAELRGELDKLGRFPSCTDYLAWADACESRLRAVFAEPQVTQQLHTQRYWYLYRFHEVQANDEWFGIDPGPDPAGQEVAVQRDFLAALTERAEQLRALAQRPGRILVYDTNALMHCQPPDLIDWAFLARADAVRLVVPLVVVDELDRKQHEGSEGMAKRARAALRTLDRIMHGTGPGAAAAVPGRIGTTLEFLMDEAEHTRRGSADDEIIERAVLLAQITGTPVTVITADTGMRLRAEATGLGTLRLADTHGKDQP